MERETMKKENSKPWILLSVLIIAFGVLYWVRIRDPKEVIEEERDLIPVNVYQVKSGEIASYQNYSGKLISGEEAKITPAGMTEITAIHVKQGDKVEAGQLLMELDSREIDMQISKAKAALEGMREMLAKAEAEGEKLEKEKIRLDQEIKLIEEKLQQLIGNESLPGKLPESIPPTDMEMSLLIEDVGAMEEITQLTKELAALKAMRQALETNRPTGSGGAMNLEGLQQSYESLVEMKKGYYIQSPIAGSVTNLTAKVGEKPNFLLPAMVIANNQTLSLKLWMSLDHLDKIEVGMQIPIEIMGLSEEVKFHTGKVVTKASEPDMKTMQYEVEIRIDNPSQELSSGSYGKIRIPIEERKEALIVPKDTLLRRQEETYVYVVKSRENPVVYQKNVQIGIENDKEAEVEKGLQEGMMIVLEGKEFVSQGEEVYLAGGEVQ